MYIVVYVYLLVFKKKNKKKRPCSLPYFNKKDEGSNQIFSPLSLPHGLLKTGFLRLSSPPSFQ